MQLVNRNFGINGQDHDYDSFLCLSKRCKKRKEARHKARMSKRESKTDQRRAETEQMRAETLLMKAMAQRNAAPTPTSNATPAPTLTNSNVSGANAKPQVTKAGFGSSGLMMVVGLLVVGGFIYNNMKNKKAGIEATPTPTPATA